MTTLNMTLAGQEVTQAKADLITLGVEHFRPLRGQRPWRASLLERFISTTKQAGYITLEQSEWREAVTRALPVILQEPFRYNILQAEERQGTEMPTGRDAVDFEDVMPQWGAAKRLFDNKREDLVDAFEELAREKGGATQQNFLGYLVRQIARLGKS